MMHGRKLSFGKSIVEDWQANLSHTLLGHALITARRPRRGSRSVTKDPLPLATLSRGSRVPIPWDWKRVFSVRQTRVPKPKGGRGTLVARHMHAVAEPISMRSDLSND
jgi:hypothetical protein